jgi:hypothetical protein
MASSGKEEGRKENIGPKKGGAWWSVNGRNTHDWGYNHMRAPQVTSRKEGRKTGSGIIESEEEGRKKFGQRREGENWKQETKR